MNLKNLYENYYQNPIKEWIPLFQNLQNYNFEGFENLYKEILSLKPDFITDSLNLKSNTKTIYPFSPNFFIENVENVLRHQVDDNEYIFVWDQFRRKNYHTSSTKKRKKIIHGVYMNNIWQNWNIVSDFIKSRCIKSKMWVVGFPYSLNQMMLNEPFLQDIKEYIHGFINTDSPAFVNTSLLPKFNLKFNDQMINWKSGVNFYTCDCNKKHFLPIFAKKNGRYYNLLNLHRLSIPFDDWFEINSPFYTCPCGKITCDFKFIPHYKNFLERYDYDKLMEIKDKLFSKMRWIQFIQEKENIKVCYETIENDIEKDIIEYYLGKNISFHKGEWLQIGAKFPCFWRNNIQKMYL